MRKSITKIFQSRKGTKEHEAEQQQQQDREATAAAAAAATSVGVADHTQPTTEVSCESPTAAAAAATSAVQNRNCVATESLVVAEGNSVSSPTMMNQEGEDSLLGSTIVQNKDDDAPAATVVVVQQQQHQQQQQSLDESTSGRGGATEAPHLVQAYNRIAVLEQTKLPRGGVSVETKAVGRVQVRNHAWCVVVVWYEGWTDRSFVL